MPAGAQTKIKLKKRRNTRAKEKRTTRIFHLHASIPARTHRDNPPRLSLPAVLHTYPGSESASRMQKRKQRHHDTFRKSIRNTYSGRLFKFKRGASMLCFSFSLSLALSAYFSLTFFPFHSLKYMLRI